jgi:hypothetical protein
MILPSVSGPWTIKNNLIVDDMSWVVELDTSRFLEKNITQ